MGKKKSIGVARHLLLVLLWKRMIGGPGGSCTVTGFAICKMLSAGVNRAFLHEKDIDKY